MSRVAIFGGSFNPPHVAHVLVTAFVLSTHEIDEVLVVPTYKHPFAKSLAPFDDRVRMCELAMGWLPRVHVSRVEEELGGESLTLHTLQHLKKMHPDWSMQLVLGSDTFAESSKWFRFEEVKQLAPPIVLSRPGAPKAEGAPVLLPEVSSTDVRNLVARGEWDRLRELVPRAALAYIRDHELYRGDPPECASRSSAQAK